jgi:hypothetical protein
MAAERRITIAGLLAIVLMVSAGCQLSQTTRPPESYIDAYQDFPPDIERFQVCSNIHCEDKTALSLDRDSWQRLAANFNEKAQSAKAEREQIKSAIGLFEQIVGPLAKTQTDQPRNKIGKLGDPQLDCIAETVNTTTYLLLFREQGWLQWHDVALPRHRGFFSGHWPHNTAVIREKQTGREFVVDSWFYANGKLPVIVPAESWQAGYDPGDE